jgi:uncharacterized RDD family membrane protein YckC
MATDNRAADLVDETPHYAGLAIRLLAIVIDYVVVIAGYLALIFIAGRVAAAQAPSLLPRLFQTNAVTAEVSGFFLMTLPISAYFALSESSCFQATLGKRWLGLRIVDRAGARISLGRSVARTTLKFVPWELAHAGTWQLEFSPADPSTSGQVAIGITWLLVGMAIWSLLRTATHQTWYDRLAGTLVVHAVR